MGPWTFFEKAMDLFPHRMHKSKKKKKCIQSQVLTYSSSLQTIRIRTHQLNEGILSGYDNGHNSGKTQMFTHLFHYQTGHI